MRLNLIALVIAFPLLAMESSVGAEALDSNDLLLAGWDCESTIDDYNAAIDEINSRLRKYVRCLDNSGGHDDCSTEFRRLKRAQSDFEDAVNFYQSYCY